MDVVHAVGEQRFEPPPPGLGQQQGEGILSLGQHRLDVAKTLLLPGRPFGPLGGRAQGAAAVANLGRIVRGLGVDADQQRVDLAACIGNLLDERGQIVGSHHDRLLAIFFGPQARVAIEIVKDAPRFGRRRTLGGRIGGREEAGGRGANSPTQRNSQEKRERHIGRPREGCRGG